MEKVTVLGCREYTDKMLDDVMEKHFEQLDAGSLIHAGTKVAVKPNLIMGRSPESATTTHPAFVAAIVRAVKRLGGEVTIAESPGGPYNRQILRLVYETSGLAGCAEQAGARLNYDTSYERVPSRGGKICSSFAVIRPLLEADVIISAAKFKTHAMTNFTGAVKNMFGAVPGLMKPEFHYRYASREKFGEMLVDLCETVRPSLSFLDGIVGMEGNGPTGGSPREIGVTLSSRNPHALDLLAAYLAGFSPKEVPTLQAAALRGLCPESAAELETAGDDYRRFVLKDFKKPDSRGILFTEKIPLFLRKPISALLTPKPVIRNADCVGCAKCAQSCPGKAITIAQKKAQIDYAKCIKCFCCHEMCPEKAIDIKRLRLFGK